MSPDRFFDIFTLRLRSLLRRREVERDLDRELTYHLDQAVKENVARGMGADEARQAARRRLGGDAQIREECRDMRRTYFFESTWSDLRYAGRALGRARGFAVVMVATLALAIGATSAIFSAIQGVLLRPLPYPEPERLVCIYFQSNSQPKFALNPNDFRDFRERNHTFESMAAITRADMQLSGAADESVMLHGFAVTAGYFRTLGFRPARGREFGPADEVAGRGRQVILSDHLWRARFAADADIVGRSVMLDGQPSEVVGVMPAGMRHPGNNFRAVADGDNVDVWTPFLFTMPNDRGSHFVDVFGRLKAGVTAEQGNADLRAVLEQMKHEHTGKGWRVYLMPLYRETVGKSEPTLLVLFGAVGLLLLLACVNAANLLLARGSARMREMAIRSAVGAARGRIVRQLLAESLVISLAAAVCGALLAAAGVRGLVALLPAGFPRAAEIRLDGGVLGFTLAVAVVTGLFFGLVPALTSSRTDLQQSLRDQGRGITGAVRQQRLRNLLVVGETALACILLIGAGLMLHSFTNLLQADPGFRPQHVLTASISLPNGRYATPAQVARFYETLLERVRSLAGVEAAGAGSDLPWTGYDENADGFTVEGFPEAKTTSRYHSATPDYFRALGTPLVSGHSFDGREAQAGPYVIVVNESFANRYWPGKSALGKRIAFNSHPQEKDWMQIVGVVRDVKDRPDSATARPAFWMPHTQQTERAMSVVVRSSRDAAELASQFRATVRQLDASLAVANLRLMTRVADEALAARRFALSLVGLFAVLALALASFGMYGVISYAANQRTQEFGIRAALGARPRDLVGIMVGQGLALAGAGIAAGSVGALAAARLMGSLLYGVRGADPAAFAGVALLAGLTAALACYIPARRAGRADPVRSLRSE